MVYVNLIFRQYAAQTQTLSRFRVLWLAQNAKYSLTKWPIYTEYKPGIPFMRIVLGSSSPYRALLLKRIITDFDIASPDIDESPLPNEDPTALVLRLAESKAQRIAEDWDNHLIISSDQVALLPNDEPLNPNHKQTEQYQILNKPGNFERAYQQLSNCSGKRVIYRTACCVLNSSTDSKHVFHDDYCLHFKDLTEYQIENYLLREQPYDCAGAIKSEGLGVALIASYKGNDPATLIGLPLIKLIDALDKESYPIL
jgi:septum formation protein